MSWHRTWLFARRTMKEIMRDPVNLFFGLAFPVLLLWALSLIYKQVGQIPGAATISGDELAAAISAYAPVFVSLFSGMLIAKDRTSSFLTRLFASPMTAADFTLGYSLPMSWWRWRSRLSRSCSPGYSAIRSACVCCLGRLWFCRRRSCTRR
ncbi:hypothetical protein [Bifidobacterium animalis]|uniref:hypothetical protein n=1 Tax=Bifidobacterium animalis TaxID=28025 RepID=UPI0010CFD76B|nr:hypothetical protein [Bifidobacterium animalis]RYN08366.1 ABC transporter permease [Bifidobacterium animalis subsp. lactis]